MRKWTSKETAFFHDHAGEMSFSRIALHMGRTEDEIYRMWRTLTGADVVVPSPSACPRPPGVRRERVSWKDRLKEVGFERYSDYIESPHWTRIRDHYARSGQPRECLGCRSPHFQLHHRTYSRLCRERLLDLIPLCADCHNRVHAYHREHCIRLEDLHLAMVGAFGWSFATLCRKMKHYRTPRTKWFEWHSDRRMADPRQEKRRIARVVRAERARKRAERRERRGPSEDEKRVEELDRRVKMYVKKYDGSKWVPIFGADEPPGDGIIRNGAAKPEVRMERKRERARGESKKKQPRKSAKKRKLGPSACDDKIHVNPFPRPRVTVPPPKHDHCGVIPKVTAPRKGMDILVRTPKPIGGD